MELWRSGRLPGVIVTSVSWSPTGDELVAVTSRGRATVFSSTGDVLWGVDGVSIASWSPDGSAIAMAVEDKLIVFSSSGEELWEVETGDLYEFYPGYIKDIDWSPSGDKLAIATLVPIVLSKDGEKLWTGGEVNVGSLDWSPDGGLLAVGGYRGVYVYTSEGEVAWEHRIPIGNKTFVNRVVWSPDGGKLAAIARVKLLLVLSRGGEVLWDREMESDILSIDWHPDSSMIAIGIMKGYKAYVLSTDGEVLWDRYIGRAVYVVDWSPDGSKLAVGDGYLIKVFSERGEELWSETLRPALSMSLDWSPDGRIIAVGCGKRVYVFGERGVGVRVEKKPPIARFSTTSREGFVVGAELVFNASESRDPDGSIVKYVWDFGDGTTLETENPVVTHVYDAPGTYTVVLTVVDDDGLESRLEVEVTIAAIAKPTERAGRFESDCSTLRGWVEYGGWWGSVGVVELSESHYVSPPYSLHIRSEVEEAAYLLRNVTEIDFKKPYVVTVWVYLEGDCSGVVVYQDRNIRLSIIDNVVKVLEERPSEYRDVVRLERGEWYKLVVEVDPESRSATVSVGGVSVVSSIPARGMPTSARGGEGYVHWDVVIGDLSHSAGVGNLYIDDLKIAQSARIEKVFDFRISVEPARIEMKQGETRTVTIEVELLEGEAGEVELSITGLPSGVKCSFDPPTVTPPGESKLVIEAGAVKGEFRLVVRGVSGEIVRTAELDLVVEEKRCIIATVTYGSEVEGVVDFLRWFRDSIVLSTYAGRRFYAAFDAFYYSWSPAAAQLVHENPWLKPVVRALLYPLILSLKASTLAAQPLLPLNPEVAVFVAGAVASTLIGLVYFSPLAYLAFRSLGASSTPLKALWIAALASVLLSAMGEALGIDGVLTIGTSTYVLSIISLASLTPVKLVMGVRSCAEEENPRRA